MKFIKVLLTISLCIFALLGDYIVFKSKYSSSFPFRALSDSVVHAGVGLFSSLLFFTRDHSLTSNICIYNVTLCTIASSVIDIDHFFVAKSIYLKDLSGLNQRGVFHCTTFWLLLTTILLSYTYFYKHVDAYISTWMLVVAFTSHHIRDANRRGLWCCPFGHTPPLPTNLYITLLATLPHLFSVMCAFMRPVIVKPFDYSLIV
ncbi:hypothetical protein ABMA28_012677 [Loxostege sticticalis]|uniref:Transmembrane protein 267 n=1 Tax=Loxostege sticticalis TaxID=481309 RepID=A0ABD0S4N9_LOXSC